MDMDEIREFAKALGIQSVSKFTNKEDLIRTIQLSEGNQDCFKRIPGCTEKTCTWYVDCIESES